MRPAAAGSRISSQAGDRSELSSRSSTTSASTSACQFGIRSRRWASSFSRPAIANLSTDAGGLPPPRLADRDRDLLQSSSRSGTSPPASRCRRFAIVNAERSPRIAAADVFNRDARSSTCSQGLERDLRPLGIKAITTSRGLKPRGGARSIAQSHPADTRSGRFGHSHRLLSHLHEQQARRHEADPGVVTVDSREVGPRAASSRRATPGCP